MTREEAATVTAAVTRPASKTGAPAGTSMTPEEISSILAVNANWPYAAQEDGWVIAHNCIRTDMKDLQDAINKSLELCDAGHPLESWQVTSLKAFTSHVLKFVHHHHDNEEEIFFPFIEQRVKMPERMAADHKTLMDQMADCAHKVAQLSASGDARTDAVKLATFKEAYSAMRSAMVEHLKEEEDVGLPLVRKHFNRTEILKGPEKEIVSNLTPEDLAHVIRHMPTLEKKKEWMTKVAGVPGIIQALVIKPAIKKYEKKWVRMVNELIAGKRMEVVRAGCFGA